MQGLLTEQDLNRGQVQWLSLDQETGKLSYKGNLYPGIAGKLLGFDTHTFTFQNRPQPKIDIYIGVGDEVFDIQLGLYGWLSWRTLNMFMTVIDKLEGGENIMIRAGKQGDNYNLSVSINGKYLKWSKTWEEAGFKGMDANDQAYNRNKMIDKWIARLVDKMKFDANQAKEYHPETVGMVADNVPF